ncbi:hypothetical protein [Ramlibacter montanisoli]|uniref:Uncharacterized protein n=1 Tax=Ramlibacter montanisoli TaxID=2732512 RepID=A0A849KJD9_9BURK|nr:hypothetical protein [Ramlibacter montanisoli]NNU44945.1 hypothetical protein [Ramlibacter montanisoli]
MQQLRGWLREQGLAPANERIQADAHLACTALRTGLQDAQPHLGREYLVEKLESNLERWSATGLYPGLALGAGQRFASKAGYLVRFEPRSGGLAPSAQRSAP